MTTIFRQRCANGTHDLKAAKESILSLKPVDGHGHLPHSAVKLFLNCELHCIGLVSLSPPVFTPHGRLFGQSGDSAEFCRRYCLNGKVAFVVVRSVGATAMQKNAKGTQKRQQVRLVAKLRFR